MYFYELITKTIKLETPSFADFKQENGEMKMK